MLLFFKLADKEKMHTVWMYSNFDQIKQHITELVAIGHPTISPLGNSGKAVFFLVVYLQNILIR